MTKDNLIFLGACTLAAPYTLAYPTSGEMDMNVKRALEWAKKIYEIQHAAPGTCAEGSQLVQAAPAPIKWVYIVEYQNWIGEWVLSTVEFATRAEAEKAMKDFGGHPRNYRVTAKLSESTPAKKYIVERSRPHNDRWDISVVAELKEPFSSLEAAQKAIKEHAVSTFQYRVREVK